ncbi:MAG: hypothetical protein WBF06_05505 [Candidatus Acidiferrales bacterium]
MKLISALGRTWSSASTGAVKVVSSRGVNGAAALDVLHMSNSPADPTDSSRGRFAVCAF